MANSQEVEGDPKQVKLSAEASTLVHSSTKDITSNVTGDTTAFPCLIPSFADACKLVKAPYSCLVMDTHRRHITLPPVYLNKKRTGIQQELNAELLKYSESLNGVPLAYDNIKVVGQHGDIYDDQGFIHLNIEASFIIFKPKKGQRLVGVINKVGVSHVGCLVHGCFNASILKPSQMTTEMWRDCGLNVGDHLQFEVFQLDADTAGVLLIRGRLEKSRVEELLAVSEPSNDSVDVAVESANESVLEPASESTDSSPSKKKKKKKHKHKDEEAADNSVVVESSLGGETINQDMNGTELDSNSNGYHKEKKKKKKKEKEREEVSEVTEETPSPTFPGSDSSGYMSDKAGKKRKKTEGESDICPLDDSEEPVVKKKKKK
ncbi:DNA-directed RNA polymerase I subunit RPA43 [Chanos chanos]|uniref:DNA-directed RNA polymerase subunit n=1 Tax=Chanos chanos TaxID=29144 RepID=A0A6J2WKA0_CHACN|nr:DNA-directed RNA polymerase I subunit RPA43 [Chanos chanos]